MDVQAQDDVISGVKPHREEFSRTLWLLLTINRSLSLTLSRFFVQPNSNQTCGESENTHFDSFYKSRETRGDVKG